jgi:hypothetical protein
VAGTKVICNPRGFTKTFNVDANPQFNRELVLPVYFENELYQQNAKKNKIK